MPIRRPLLPPRFFRLDDLLRRPYFPAVNTGIGSSGGTVSVAGMQGWGFTGSVASEKGMGDRFDAPLTLTITADGVPLLPVDAVYRPSHVTLNAEDGESGLQISEDKFVSEDDVLVSVLSLRNPGEYAVEVEIAAKWGVKPGEYHDTSGVPYYVRRAAPPLDDRRAKLPGGKRHQLIFTLAFAHDDRFARAEGETAELRARRWAGDPSPVRTQTEAFQAWEERNVVRFDCPDSWCVRYWYHWYHLYRKYPTRRPPSYRAPSFARQEALSLENAVRGVRAQFVEDNFEQPLEATEYDWPALFVERVMGFRRESGKMHLTFAPDLADWPYFCVENWLAEGRRWTFVWDDPNAREDVYDDGDKGFTVYDGDTVVYHQNDLSPCTVDLVQKNSMDEDEEE